jgi:HlyD family secretion protein
LKKAVGAVLVLAAALAAYWVLTRKSEAASVPFYRAARETISNVLSTNGKVEPREYVEVHAEATGLLKRLLVQNGDTVRKDQVIAELSEPGVQQELDAASAREAQARAEMQTLQAGGRPVDTADIEASLSRLRTEREAAQRNLDSLERLQKQQAATQYEADQARQVVKNLDVQIQSAGERRAALVAKGDVAAAQARVREAEANVQLSRSRLAQDVIRAPMAGTIYDLPVRAGSYLNPGDAVASIGQLDPVRVRVYVDEPELGRVAPGENVRITWDALPGKEWTGVVEKKPTEIVALGSRQVGEVLCTIANPGRDLVPGTNVNAFILTQVVKDALTIPKETVRRDNGVGVYLLQSDQSIKWQPVTTGASSTLRVEVVNGLKDGDAVAGSTEQAMKNGLKVKAVFP